MTQTPSVLVVMRRHGAVAEIHIDHPPVNALGHAVRAQFLANFDAARNDPTTKLILITAGGRLFSGGADINEFTGPFEPPHLPELIDHVENSDVPVAIALHGTAMGGALELAMGCHYRLAAPGARLGLPEVRIGIIPGAGGTQRMPRLIGAEAALDLITRGAAIPAANAQSLGLVDDVIDDADFAAAALAWAQRQVQAGVAPRRTRERSVSSMPALFEAARAKVSRLPGNRAAMACIDAVEAATQTAFADGMARERDLFAQCVVSEESIALRHVFFAERRAAVVPDLADDVQPRRVEEVAVLGAGTMGAGIAMTLADAGLDVALFDQSPDALQRGLAGIAKQYVQAAERGRIGTAEAQARTARIRGGDEAALAQVDLVIEAVFEDLALKQRVFADLDRACRPGAILATNTSTLDVDAIASATQRPGDVLGLHFFSPANVMRLLEIVRAEKTADDVLATAIALSKRLGKVGVVSGVCDGFIGNRMLEGYLRECGLLLLEGASPSRIDAVLMAWGWAMGPFGVSDLAGIDIGHRVREQRGIDGTTEACYAVGEKLYQLGRYGQKTGAGFYRYEPGQRKPIPDPEIDAIIATEAERFGIVRREIGDEEIVERCVLPLINEGARLLEEGIALRASDIDLVWLYGYGFPAFRGGPMHYANRLGLDRVLAGLHRYDNGAAYWRPSSLIQTAAAEASVLE